MKTKFYLLVLIALFSNIHFLKAQTDPIINIPDANFKAHLLSSSITNNIAKDENGNSIVIDINGDGEIQQSEALQVISLNAYNSSTFFHSIIGIENFTNLEVLDCHWNVLESLDVSQLSNLTTLICNNNRLTNLNVSGLTNLKILNCGFDTTIPTPFPNELQQLDLSDLINLEELYCNSNQLTSLDCSNSPNLSILICNLNNLIDLNLTGLTNLQKLNCSYNQLTSLNVSDLVNLNWLDCSSSQISNLDLSNLSNLSTLFCEENPLVNLNIKNGYTTYPNFSLFFLFSYPNLHYICCDDSEIDAFQTQLINHGYTNVSINSYCTFTPGGNYYIIHGNTKFDYNNNGCDENDTSYPYLKYSITNGINPGYFFGAVNGDYSIPVSSGIYTMSPSLEKS